MLHLASVFQHDQGATHVGGFLCSSNECAYVSGVIKFSGNHVKALKCLFLLFVSAVVGWLFWSSVVEAPAVLLASSSVMCGSEDERLTDLCHLILKKVTFT